MMWFMGNNTGQNMTLARLLPILGPEEDERMDGSTVTPLCLTLTKAGVHAAAFSPSKVPEITSLKARAPSKRAPL